MSKFVDKLHNLSKSSVSPIGFHGTASEPKSSLMLLVAGLSELDAREAENIANSNVDAGLILSQSFNITSLNQTAKAMGDIPLA